MPNKTVYRKDYTPYPFSIASLHLSIDLYADYTIVTSQMELKRLHPGELFLNGEHLELIGIEWSGRLRSSTEYDLSEKGLRIPSFDEGLLKLTTRIYPQNNTALSGLYQSNQLFCTQCEAEGFRRITYFPDRPDVLTIFTTRICADKQFAPVLLSNGNLIDKGESADGRHWVVWHDPFKKPSYLFALVAGTLACVEDTFVTSSGKTVQLRIYVEPGNEGRCVHAMTSLKKAMRWDEEQYGREYDLDTFMIVAVSDFNMGAMENKGLNIFNAKYILACPKSATDEDYADIEGIIGHEYFHNWTGNRVTCRDWFQLSLKEGLTVFRDQEFSADMNSRDVNRIMDVRILQNSQFPEDAGSMAHPVRPDSYQEINNFYTATVYNKGAEVIRMQHTLLGKAGFRRGMDLYFERHDGDAVTIDDFVKAMEDANRVDFTQFKQWYSQAGTPLVCTEKQFSENTLTLKLTQTCPPTPECRVKKPFHIPICIALFEPSGNLLQETVLELKDKCQTFHFGNLTNEPFVSLLRHFSAPIKLQQRLTQEEGLAILRFESDGYAKWNAAQTLVVEMQKSFLCDPTTEITIPLAFIHALEHLLNDTSVDPALCAYLILPPDYEALACSLSEIDVSQVERIRDAYRKNLGEALWESLHKRFQTLSQQESNALGGDAYGRRKLKNTCLYLMMKAREKNTIETCLQQFNTAQNMTDKMASFSLLVNANADAPRAQALESFYREWSDNELVMEKWFAVQATSERDGTLSHVKALLSHPDFHLTNPNKVRALLGAFVHNNVRHFHAPDGSGYQFLTDMLLKLDPINPQITARLATPFTRGARLDRPRRAMIQKQLHHLSLQSLSPDLREMVEKSLDQGE